MITNAPSRLVRRASARSEGHRPTEHADDVSPISGSGSRHQLTVSREGGEVTCSVDGEVDLATIPQMQNDLAQEIDRHPARVVLDLSGVTFFMGSGGSHLLEDLAVLARSRRVGFTVRGARARIRQVLEITGVASDLDLVP